MQATFLDVQVTPVDMQVTPVDMQATYVDMQATSVDMQATSVDMQVTSVDMPVTLGTPNGRGACRACPLEVSEVTISLHSGLGRSRTAMAFEAGNEIDVAAPQVSVHSDCNAVPPGPLLYFVTSLSLRLSWELLTGRYGEDSGGGGGGRVCDVGDFKDHGGLGASSHWR